MKKKRKSQRKPLDLPTTPIRTDQRLDEHQKEQMLNVVDKASKLTSLAFVLGDVINSAMLDCEDTLKLITMSVRHEDKQRLNNVLSSVRSAKNAAAAFAKVIYQQKTQRNVDDSVEDSDWYYDLHRAMIDHCGDNQEKLNAVMEFVKGLPTGRKKLVFE
jgi:hypothetical protein